MDSNSFIIYQSGVPKLTALPALAVDPNPPTPFTPQKLAKQILVQLEMFPETHDQSSFLGEGNCGTTMCVAGWAQFLRDGKVNISTVVQDAAELLGLDEIDAEYLFYFTDNEMAVEALKLIANGEPLRKPRNFLGLVAQQVRAPLL